MAPRLALTSTFDRQYGLSQTSHPEFLTLSITSKEHSRTFKRIAMLAHIGKLILGGAAVFLVGDYEFGSVALVRQLVRWCQFYVLPEADSSVWISENSGW
jgi:hypothetical protein